MQLSVAIELPTSWHEAAAEALRALMERVPPGTLRPVDPAMTVETDEPDHIAWSCTAGAELWQRDPIEFRLQASDTTAPRRGTSPPGRGAESARHAPNRRPARYSSKARNTSTAF